MNIQPKTILGKVGKILLYTIGTLILISVVIFAIGSKHENESKKLLASEVSSLSVPPTCTEKNMVYTAGGLDTESTWSVDYSCKTIGKQAYDFITSGLTARGYQAKEDFSKGGPGIFYDFTYTSSKFWAHYYFNGINGPSYTIDQTNLLEQAPVSEIHLDISRNN